MSGYTVRSMSYLLGTSFADGQAPGAIVAGNIRDFVGSIYQFAGPYLAANNQTANYTLALTDVGLCVVMNSASALTLSVPANSLVNFSVGTVVNVLQFGAGQVTISGQSGVSLFASTPTTPLTTRTQYSFLTLWQYTTNGWLVSGDLT